MNIRKSLITLLSFILFFWMVGLLSSKFRAYEQKGFERWYQSWEAIWYNTAISNAFLCEHPEYSEIGEVNVWVGKNGLDCEYMYIQLDKFTHEVFKSIETREWTWVIN